MSDIHFIRPWWFLACIPLLLLIWQSIHQQATKNTLNDICDSHLLPFLIKKTNLSHPTQPLFYLFTCALLMIISLAGPTWSRLPVPTFQPSQARVIVLDLSDAMLATDRTPSRLVRAKFKLHDLFQSKQAGQFGLVVYTSQPFVVSPLTDDGQTIDALLPVLAPNIMPVAGHNLSLALQQAQQLITQAGFETGDILVITAHEPSDKAIKTAQSLARNTIYTSIMSIQQEPTSQTTLKRLATAGKGLVISFTNTNADINSWLKQSRHHQQHMINKQQTIPIWRDQGRWFLIPALLLLLPVFRRGWLQRINS